MTLSADSLGKPEELMYCANSKHPIFLCIKDREAHPTQVKGTQQISRPRQQTLPPSELILMLVLRNMQ